MIQFIILLSKIFIYIYIFINLINAANNCIWLILDILQTQMPSINDLMIEVIEKEMSHVDEFKLTVIVSMFRMISKVCFYVILIINI